MDNLKKKLECNPHVMCADNVLIEMKRDNQLFQVISTGDANVFTVRRGDNRQKKPDEVATFQTTCSYVVDYHVNSYRMITNTLFPKGIETALEICKEVFHKETDPTGKIAAKIYEDYRRNMEETLEPDKISEVVV